MVTGLFIALLSLPMMMEKHQATQNENTKGRKHTCIYTQNVTKKGKLFTGLLHPSQDVATGPLYVIVCLI